MNAHCVHHGGGLRAAAADSAIPLADWLDVSTGIAPWSWPVPSLPDDVWARLPEADDGLIAVAADYYQQAPERLVAVPGSQFAIRALPEQVPPGRVGLPRVGYREHEQAWQMAGHTPVYYDSSSELAATSAGLDYAVLLAPNNPLGDMPTYADCQTIADRLGTGRLIVDAAFLDCASQPPMLPETAITLRSVGKFFGLAGIRLGFAIGPPEALADLAQRVEPWGVSHPARWVGARALADEAWQAAQRRRIADGEAWLLDCLATHMPEARLASGGLFVTACFESPHAAPAWYAALARQGVLTRLGDDNHWLRFGLVRHTQRQRLATAVHAARVYPQGH